MHVCRFVAARSRNQVLELRVQESWRGSRGTFQAVSFAKAVELISTHPYFGENRAVMVIPLNPDGMGIGE